MKFELLPILEAMLELYAQPRGYERFGQYLNMLTGGNSNELELPIPVYNPMAKAHLPTKLRELQALNAEHMVQQAAAALNQGAAPTPLVRVALVMADDLKGGWTNRYSTDYSCRFQTRGILRRNFCTPVFWVSEQLDERTVRSRVWEYLFRFQYQYEHGMPQSLQDHIFQEANIQKQLETLQLEWKHSLGRDVLAHAAGLFARHRHSQHYATMFSFLYGDEAAAQFGYPLPGLPPFAGLLLAPALGDV